MSSGSACWILWLTPMDWLALSIGRSGSQPLEYSLQHVIEPKPPKDMMDLPGMKDEMRRPMMLLISARKR